MAHDWSSRGPARFHTPSYGVALLILPRSSSSKGIYCRRSCNRPPEWRDFCEAAHWNCRNPRSSGSCAANAKDLRVHLGLLAFRDYRREPQAPPNATLAPRVEAFLAHAEFGHENGGTPLFADYDLTKRQVHFSNPRDGFPVFKAFCFANVLPTKLRPNLYPRRSSWAPRNSQKPWSSPALRSSGSTTARRRFFRT